MAKTETEQADAINRLMEADSTPCYTQDELISLPRGKNDVNIIVLLNAMRILELYVENSPNFYKETGMPKEQLDKTFAEVKAYLTDTAEYSTLIW